MWPYICNANGEYAICRQANTTISPCVCGGTTPEGIPCVYNDCDEGLTCFHGKCVEPTNIDQTCDFNDPDLNHPCNTLCVHSWRDGNSSKCQLECSQENEYCNTGSDCCPGYTNCYK